MNLRHPKLVTTLRVLLGLFMLMSGVTGLMALGNNMEGIPAPMVPAMKTLAEMGIFQLVKAVEAIVGILLVTGIAAPLAIVMLAPISIGVTVFNSMIAPPYVVTALIVTAFNLYFGYVYWDKYKPLFAGSKK